MSEMKNSKFSCLIKYLVNRISLLTISILIMVFTDCRASQSFNYQPDDSVVGVITDLYTGEPLYQDLPYPRTATGLLSSSQSGR